MTEEMQDLLGKYFSGEATSEEITVVKNWVAASEQNESDFKLLEKMWNTSGDQDLISFDTDKAWKKVSAKLNPSITRKSSPTILITAVTSIAAAVIVLFGIWWLMTASPGMQTVVADTDTKEVLLADGSKVYLRKGASLKFPEKFAAASREVTLEGEAFFDVVANEARPFIIAAATANVKVVGTSFTVRNKNDSVSVTVKTGRVFFTPAGDTTRRILLAAGESALYAAHQMKKWSNADINFDAWITKKLVFRNTPLRDILVKISDYYRVNVYLKDDLPASTGQTVVTITFDGQPLPSVLNDLQRVTSLQIRKLNENDYEVSKE